MNDGVDYGILPELTGYHLRRAQVALFANYARMVGKLRVTPGQFGVIAIIGANPGISQSALARAIGIERSTMVAAIDVLENRKFVERRASPADRRSNALVLSSRGEAVLAQVVDRVREHEREFLSSLDDGERTVLKKLLERLWTGYVFGSGDR